VDRFTFAVRLKPRTGRDIITAMDPTQLQVSVKAPPVHNKANEALIALVAKWLGYPRTSVTIIKGGHSRNKVLSCEGLSEGHFRSCMENLEGSGKK
jgi:uncharacterized protein